MAKRGPKPIDDLPALQCMALKVYLNEADSGRSAVRLCQHLAPVKPGTKPESVARRLRGKYSRIERQLLIWAQEELQERHWRARPARRPINPARADLFDTRAAKPPRFSVARVDRSIVTRTDAGLFRPEPEPRPRRTISTEDLLKALQQDRSDGQ